MFKDALVLFKQFIEFYIVELHALIRKSLA